MKFEFWMIWPAICSILLSVSIYFTIIAMSDCGFKQTLIFGKSLVWAWYFGYCE